MVERGELIERLEKATGPDRELDEALARFTRWHPIKWREWPPHDPPDYWFSDAFGMPFYTSSLDAAIALVERVLPGADISMSDIHADFLREGEPRHIAEISADLTWVTYDHMPEPEYETNGTAAYGAGKAGQREERMIARKKQPSSRLDAFVAASAMLIELVAKIKAINAALRAEGSN